MSNRILVGPSDDDIGTLAVEVFCGERLMLFDDDKGAWRFPQNGAPHSNRYLEFVRKWGKSQEFRNSITNAASNVEMRIAGVDDTKFACALKKNAVCAALYYVFGPSIASLYGKQFLHVYMSVSRVKKKMVV